MEARELRIGNYVDWIDRSNQVHLPANLPKMVGSIGLFDIDLYFMDQTISGQQPHKILLNAIIGIPFTKDRLLNLCFEEIEKDIYSHYYNGVCTIDVILGKGTPLVGIFKGDSPIEKYPHIQSIHKLQNLYYSKTDKELMK